ncbi:MAG TPA: hypothetical protein DCP26_00205, partial [Brevundimonas sp.]|nr:hypothetical protein [Brevundimonas sp.]
MRTLTAPDRWLALLLAALAGYVDSLGFLHLGGVFVSFMSGNSTRLAVSLAEGRWQAAGAVAGVLALFGAQISEQVTTLIAIVPLGWAQVQTWIEAQPYAA